MKVEFSRSLLFNEQHGKIFWRHLIKFNSASLCQLLINGSIVALQSDLQASSKFWTPFALQFTILQYQLYIIQRKVSICTNLKFRFGRQDGFTSNRNGLVFY